MLFFKIYFYVQRSLLVIILGSDVANNISYYYEPPFHVS